MIWGCGFSPEKQYRILGVLLNLRSHCRGKVDKKLGQKLCPLHKASCSGSSLTTSGTRLQAVFEIVFFTISIWFFMTVHIYIRTRMARERESDDVRLLEIKR